MYTATGAFCCSMARRCGRWRSTIRHGPQTTGSQWCKAEPFFPSSLVGSGPTKHHQQKRTRVTVQLGVLCCCSMFAFVVHLQLGLQRAKYSELDICMDIILEVVSTLFRMEGCQTWQKDPGIRVVLPLLVRLCPMRR